MAGRFLSGLFGHRLALRVQMARYRLDAVRAADQLLVLDDGVITERGRHDELGDAGGTYAAFWHDRVAAEGWRLVSGA